MGKEKKQKHRENEEENNDATESKEGAWDQQVSRIGPIANPLASRKLSKKLYKVIKKAQDHKRLRKGIRDVQKCVRKGETGVIVMAGDTNPVEVICHMPLICEEKDIPYCYTPSKESLGTACGSRRPTCMVLIKPHEDYEDLYHSVEKHVKALPLPL